MTLPLPEHLAHALEQRDPLGRYRAVQAAREAVTAFLADVETQAVRDLIADHQGNKSAAGREMGMTPQALHDWLKRRAVRDLDDPAVFTQEQPALHFANEYDAEDALRDWQLKQQRIEDLRDPLVLGALAAGLAPESIYRYSGIPLHVTRRLHPTDDPIQVSVGSAGLYDVFDDTARALDAHARALLDQAVDRAGHDVARLWRLATEGFVKNLAPTALEPEMPKPLRSLQDRYMQAMADFNEAWEAAHPDPDDTPGDDDWPEDLRALDTEYWKAHREWQDSLPKRGFPDIEAQLRPDAWLAAEVTELRRLATAPQQPATEEGDPKAAAARRQAYADIATAYTHLRATGTVPPLPATEVKP
ncbi:hypothetical protein [Kitasatospora aureofaciens]|uniref:hypothetical protein n=1 Tax=Kitasatospora aureofaciens TaxID=1894 RepID=UPI0005251EE9|nr:hypothetical protein [Kitasatospora aureofaciens]